MSDAAAPSARLTAWLEETRTWAERELDRALPGEDEHPARLSRAMRYTVFGGGKRLRPALCRLVCASCGGADTDAASPAAALELVHTYSLVHDDLPCMDDDELRRGRPTCHVAFDEATAVLTGDALLTLAFAVVARAGEDAVSCLSEAAGAPGMIGGQMLDLELERPSPEEGSAAVSDMHWRKTAALFGAAAELGAIAAGDVERRTPARAFGLALGLAFQAVDDLLDVTGDAATLGKTPGKDAALQRPTLVAALGLEGARAEARRRADEALAAADQLGWAPASLGVELVHYVLARRA